MALENKRLLTFILCVIANISLASGFPILATKQPIQNIRFVSNDGILTYFQNRRGKLLFSSNYNISTVLQKKKDTFFTMLTTPHKKFFLIEAQEDFFKTASLQADHQIYSLIYGKDKAHRIGKGQASRFHEKGTWASFYSFMKHQVTLINLEATLIKTKINIINTVLPYFIPEVILFNRNMILYTDVNKKGEQAVLFYNRETKKKRLFLQSGILGQMFQLCQSDTHIFILQTGQSEYRKGTQIYKLAKKDPVSIKSLKSIYTSSRNDIGRMVCDFDSQFIYFIKSKKSTKYSAKKNTVAQININSSEVKIIYDKQSSFNLLQLDQKLLIAAQGQYHIIKGTTKLKDDSIK